MAGPAMPLTSMAHAVGRWNGTLEPFLPPDQPQTPPQGPQGHPMTAGPTSAPTPSDGGTHPLGPSSGKPPKSDVPAGSSPAGPDGQIGAHAPAGSRPAGSDATPFSPGIPAGSHPAGSSATPASSGVPAGSRPAGSPSSPPTAASPGNDRPAGSPSQPPIAASPTGKHPVGSLTIPLSAGPTQAGDPHTPAAAGEAHADNQPSDTGDKPSDPNARMADHPFQQQQQQQQQLNELNSCPSRALSSAGCSGLSVASTPFERLMDLLCPSQHDLTQASAGCRESLRAQSPELNGRRKRGGRAGHKSPALGYLQSESSFRCSFSAFLQLRVACWQSSLPAAGSDVPNDAAATYRASISQLGRVLVQPCQLLLQLLSTQ